MTYIGERIAATERSEEQPLAGFREWAVDEDGGLLALGSRTPHAWRPAVIA